MTKRRRPTPVSQMINRNSRTFGRVFLLIVFLIVVIMSIRVLMIATQKQVNGHDLAQGAQDTFMQSQVLPAERGRILDCHGQVLAENTTTYDMQAVLDASQQSHVTDVDGTADKLSHVIDLKKDALVKILSQKDKKQVEFGTAGKNLSVIQQQQIEQLHLAGITFTAQASRSYPNGRMASHIIGYVDKDTDQQTMKGVLGIEAANNSDLAGKNGVKSYSNTASDHVGGTAAQNGKDVYLTLDVNLQTTLENKMTDLVASMKPKRAVAMLVEAKTGKIVAASQRPNYDPATKQDLNQEWRNLIAQGPFEPGSTMKPFTLTAAIENNKWQPKATFTSGTVMVDGKPIHDFEQNMGTISYEEGFWRSSNVAFARLQQQMGATKWRQKIDDYRFLKATHAGFDNEETGSIAYRYPIEQANTAFGQGITMTPLQIVQAYSAIANDGDELRPQIVDHLADAQTGTVSQTATADTVAQPLKASTAKTIRKEMINVVNKPTGTAREFDLRNAGYQISAKTGTAQIASGGRYLDGFTNAIHSVAVLAPADKPEYVFYMAVDSPQKFPDTSIQTTMNKLFRPVMLQALNRSKQGNPTTTTQVTVPKVTGKSVAEARETLTKAGFRVANVGESGTVSSLSLPEGQSALSGQLIVIKARGDRLMPNMIGWTLSDAQQFAKIANVPMTWDGDGYVASQNLAEHQFISEDARIRITLKQKE